MHIDRPQRTGIRRRMSCGWGVGMRARGLVLALLIGLLGLWHTGHAADFACAAGDVACLIDAITQANRNGEAHIMTLEASTYTLTAVDNNTDGSNGLPSVTSTLTIRGAGADATIIERDASAPAFRLGHVAAAGTLTLEGLTWRQGRSTGPGGGLFNLGTLTLTDCALTDNGAGDGGGGLSNQGGTVAMAQTTVARNTADGGGGLANVQGGTVTIAASLFVNNGAGHPGGGLYNSGGTVTITQTTFAHNGADPGGAVANVEAGTVLITDSSIAENGGTGLANSEFRSSGTLILINTTIARNTQARFAGGGLANVQGGTAILTNSTVTENSSGLHPGGGLLNDGGTVILTNTILARNRTSEFTTGPDCFGQVTSLGTNLIGDPTGCTIALLPTDLTGDPGLGEFTDNGMPGDGHVPLLPGSPAIDAGNDDVCPPTDQLGQPRVGPCDIGAIEFQGGDPAAASRRHPRQR